MRLLQLQQSKTVKYLGFVLTVPSNITHLVVSEKSVLLGTSVQPRIERDGLYIDGSYLALGKVELDGTNWRDTVYRIPEKPTTKYPLYGTRDDAIQANHAPGTLICVGFPNVGYVYRCTENDLSLQYQY